MFFDKQSEDDFFFSLDRELKKQHAFDSDLKTARRAQLEEHLKSAVNSLRHAGLVKEAQMVAHVHQLNEDCATKDLTPEDMVKNLESLGWQFHDPDSCAADDCAMCEGDKDLTEEELQAVRKMLKDKKSDDDDSDDAKDDMDHDSYKGLKAMFEEMDADERRKVLEDLKELV